MAWEIDPFHTSVEFSVKHLMISTVKGRFRTVRGTLHLDPKQPANSSVQAQVEAASIDTGVAQRDAHLRSADFFEVAKYPNITLVSRQIRLVSQNRCVLTGDLTLHGVTKPVQFHVEFTGRARDIFTDAWRVGMYAVTMIDRRDFGMDFNQMKTGIAFVGYEVRIDINLEASLV